MVDFTPQGRKWANGPSGDGKLHRDKGAKHLLPDTPHDAENNYNKKHGLEAVPANGIVTGDALEVTHTKIPVNRLRDKGI